MGFARGFRLVAGLLLVIVPLWVLFGQLEAIWNGHPAYPTLLLVTIAVGMTLAAFALWPWRREPEPHGPPWEADRDDDEPGRPSPGDHPTRTKRRRIVGRVIGGVITVIWLGALIWLQPFPAGATALDALRSDAQVTVIDHTTSIELAPTVPRTPTVGLVFSPGARVDSRAYAANLRPVAEAGFLVVILKEPLGLSVLQPEQPSGAIKDHPEIQTWAVGGHSLGGVTAAGFAASNMDAVSGLLLWASYPQNDMSGDLGLRVESVFGSNDGLTTPADIQESMAKLPPDTTFTEIHGGVHAYFADYGDQPGDGEPSIDRATASAQIASASTAFLGRLSGTGSAG